MSTRQIAAKIYVDALIGKRQYNEPVVKAAILVLKKE